MAYRLRFTYERTSTTSPRCSSIALVGDLLRIVNHEITTGAAEKPVRLDLVRDDGTDLSPSERDEYDETYAAVFAAGEPL